MLPYPIKLTPVEIALWVLQVPLLIFALRKRSRVGDHRTASLLACAFAIVLAWNWRLIYEFALASSGFWFLVGDDPSRWLMSTGWSHDPYFITWDAVWQGGTFYLHGAAMRLIHDPMIASKLVSGFYSVLPLLGLFFLTQGLYRNRRLSIAVVLMAAPLWVHLLLATGALAEMPVVGLMLTGLGLLLMSSDPAAGRPERLELAAAFSFALATSFHVTAWMMLVPVLLIWLGHAVRTRTRDRSSLRRWLIFAIISCSYCVLWIGVSWIKFGDPLKMFHDYAAHVIRDLGRQLPLRDRVLAYPSAIAYTLWGIFPLAMVGLFLGLFRNTEEKVRVRWVVAGAVATLLIMMESAIRANPNAHAYRSTVTLATLLIPIALAPLWPLLEEAWPPGKSRLTGTAKFTVLCLLLFAFTWIWDNHQRTLREQRELNELYSDSIGVGTWLRQEVIRPQLLDLPANGPPIRLWNPEPPLFGNIDIIYTAGYPSRLQEWTDPATPGLDSMLPGQYLITNAKVDDPRLVRQWQFGHYTVYRFHG